MIRGDFSFAKIWPASRLVLGALFMCVTASLPALAAPQADSDIPPDATPQIQQINPSQAAPGAHVTVVIQGSNFSAGAYVSSVSAAIHVESSKRVSATQLEAQLSVSASAQPSTVSLLVSNPASRAAETAFKIVAGQATTAPATESVEPPKPAAPATPAPPAGSPCCPRAARSGSQTFCTGHAPCSRCARRPSRTGSDDGRAPPRGPGLRCGFENHRQEFCSRHQGELRQSGNQGDGCHFPFEHRAYRAHQGCAATPPRALPVSL